MAYRLGVDVGGTFTDVLLIDQRTGTTHRAKTASTPHDQSVGVLNGVRKVCGQAGVELSDIAQVLHGTTVATNAILQGRGATVGLVTTRGFRQVLQIARSYVPGGLAGWIIWPKRSRWPGWSTRWKSPAGSTPPVRWSKRWTSRMRGRNCAAWLIPASRR